MTKRKKTTRLEISRFLLTALFLMLIAASISLGFILKPKPAPATSYQPTQIVEKPIVTESSYFLAINKLALSAPIILNVDGNDKEAYDKALEGGVAHLMGSALPGKPGNTFIFGHSSFYAWKPGDYKEIFATLDQLEIGDEIIITSNIMRYIYTVSDKQIVSPNEVTVASQNYSEKKLTLMTCWPVGSDAERLVIISNLKESVPIQ